MMNQCLQILSGYWKFGGGYPVTQDLMVERSHAKYFTNDCCMILFLFGWHVSLWFNVFVARTNGLLDSPSGQMLYLGYSMGLYLSILILHLHSPPLCTKCCKCGWWQTVVASGQSLSDISTYFQSCWVVHECIVWPSKDLSLLLHL